MKVEGLPEGLDPVIFAGVDMLRNDFQNQSNSYPWEGTGLLLKIKDGYEAIYDPVRYIYQIVKKLKPLQIVTITAECHNYGEVAYMQRFADTATGDGLAVKFDDGAKGVGNKK